MVCTCVLHSRWPKEQHTLAYSSVCSEALTHNFDSHMGGLYPHSSYERGGLHIPVLHLYPRQCSSEFSEVSAMEMMTCMDVDFL